MGEWSAHLYVGSVKFSDLLVGATSLWESKVCSYSISELLWMCANILRYNINSTRRLQLFTFIKGNVRFKLNR